MTDHKVTFDTDHETVVVKTGTLLSEAARLAGIDLNQPCGGQGRCGRCALQITAGTVRRRSTIRLSEEDLAKGFCKASIPASFSRKLDEGSIDIVQEDVREYSPREPQDLISCQNVLYQFDAKVQEGVVRRLCQALAPGGVLVLFG